MSDSLGAENLSLRCNLARFISCYGHVKLDQSFPKGLLKLLILLFNVSGNENGQNLEEGNKQMDQGPPPRRTATSEIT